ncbi:MAG: hypothetical protein IJJ26_08140, partial [Victivallales bacterium]|nr:hypothetical protein [Victivallales bacterium]
CILFYIKYLVARSADKQVCVFCVFCGLQKSFAIISRKLPRPRTGLTASIFPAVRPVFFLLVIANLSS